MRCTCVIALVCVALGMSGCAVSASAGLATYVHTAGYAGTELQVTGAVGLGDTLSADTPNPWAMNVHVTGGAGAEWTGPRGSTSFLAGVGGYQYLGRLGWRFSVDAGGRYFPGASNQLDMVLVQATGGFMGSVFTDSRNASRNLSLGVDLSLGAGFGGAAPAGFVATLGLMLHYDVVWPMRAQ